MYYDGWMGMHALWWVFWLVVVFALLAWVRGDGAVQRRSRERETPHEVLRRRLAAGEIDLAEYEQRKVVLDRDSPPAGA